MMFSFDHLIQVFRVRHKRSRPFYFLLITRELTQSVGCVTFAMIFWLSVSRSSACSLSFNSMGTLRGDMYSRQNIQ